MDAEIEGKRRTVIPRWRDFKTTLALGELDSIAANLEHASADDRMLSEQVADWKRNRSLAFATDLVGSGLVLGMRELVSEAADFILSEASQSTDLQQRIARQTKDSEFCLQLTLGDDIERSSSGEIVDQSKELVRKYRGLLRNAPRNPIKLVELARQYAILGSLRKALRTMDVALSLAPANRFVVRAAARLFVHAEELDKAHHAVKRAPGLRTDPWLLAAEIAVASMKEKTSSNTRLGLQKIEDKNFSPFEISELSSALATVEMENANSKRARRLFRHALISPTENSIAQAEWASRSITSLAEDVYKSKAPRNFEAPAWSHFQKGDWNNALGHGTNWILDQPFAIPPVTFSGTVASILEKFELGEDIYRFGLAANPSNPVLINNLAFVLASNNKPGLAEMELNKIDRSALNIDIRIAVIATEGLILMRKGILNEGRRLYRQAIELAHENKRQSYVVRGLVYLAREEVYAQTDMAKQSVERAEKEAETYQDHELGMLLRKLRLLAKPS